MTERREKEIIEVHLNYVLLLVLIAQRTTCRMIRDTLNR